MTAIALPSRPRKRRSKPAQVAQGAAKAWTTMKIGSTVAKTAKKGAKTYGKYRVVKFVGRHGKKLVLVPLAAGGGLVAWKKVHSSSAPEGPATPYGSTVGPAATPQTVTPPKTAPGTSAGQNGEGSLDDKPAGAANPPVEPPPGTSS
jgi:hypothetical protein